MTDRADRLLHVVTYRPPLRRDCWVDVSCAACGTRLAIGDGPPDEAQLTARAAALLHVALRPCCPAWSTTSPTTPTGTNPNSAGPA